MNISQYAPFSPNKSWPPTKSSGTSQATQKYCNLLKYDDKLYHMNLVYIIPKNQFSCYALNLNPELWEQWQMKGKLEKNKEHELVHRLRPVAIIDIPLQWRRRLQALLTPLSFSSHRKVGPQNPLYNIGICPSATPFRPYCSWGDNERYT